MPLIGFFNTVEDDITEHTEPSRRPIITTDFAAAKIIEMQIGIPKIADNNTENGFRVVLCPCPKG